MADALEAIIGAAYVDLGLEAASYIVEELVLPLLDSEGDLSLNDPKSLLHARAAALSLPEPQYETSFEGPTNDRTFESRVTIGERAAQGFGRSRKEAEKIAAAALLELLG